MLKPLDRRQQDYIAVLAAWLTCPTLNQTERNLVTYLAEEAKKSIDHFDFARRQALSGVFFGYLVSAIMKARAAGLLQDWNDYVTPT